MHPVSQSREIIHHHHSVYSDLLRFFVAFRFQSPLISVLPCVFVYILKFQLPWQFPQSNSFVAFRSFVFLWVSIPLLFTIFVLLFIRCTWPYQIKCFICIFSFPFRILSCQDRVVGIRQKSISVTVIIFSEKLRVTVSRRNTTNFRSCEWGLNQWSPAFAPGYWTCLPRGMQKFECIMVDPSYLAGYWDSITVVTKNTIKVWREQVHDQPVSKPLNKMLAMAKFKVM